MCCHPMYHISMNNTQEAGKRRFFYGVEAVQQAIYLPPELLRVVEDMADDINREKRLRGNKRMTFSKLMVKWALERVGLAEKYGQGE
jgi:hypothetical protein